MPPSFGPYRPSDWSAKPSGGTVILSPNTTWSGVGNNTFAKGVRKWCGRTVSRSASIYPTWLRIHQIKSAASKELNGAACSRRALPVTMLMWCNTWGASSARLREGCSNPSFEQRQRRRPGGCVGTWCLGVWPVRLVTSLNACSHALRPSYH